MPEIISAARRYKAALARRERSITNDMADRWLTIVRGLEGEIDDLAATMVARRAAGLPVTQGYLYRSERYKELLARAIGQFRSYDQYASRLIANNQVAFARLGKEYGLGLLDRVAAGAQAQFAQLNVEAVEAIAGFAADGSPLRSLIQAAWPHATQQMTSTLVKGVGLGYSPRRIASEMASSLNGGLYRSMVIARTETQRAYRMGKIDTWLQTGIVTGFQRIATHDARVCPACLFAEGEFFKMLDDFAEHPQGRCDMIPCTQRSGLHRWQMGPEWFARQSQQTQVSILGVGRHALWQSGGLDLRDIPQVVPNDTWGPSLRARTLHELTGGATRRSISLPGTIRPGGAQNVATPVPVAPVATSTALSEGRTKIVAAERRIFRQSYESSYSVHDDGAVMLSKDGEKYSVTFDDIDVRLMKGTITTHNHPRGWEVPATDPRRVGNSFSPEDIHLASLAQLNEMRAVTPKYVYVMKPPAGGWNETTWTKTIKPAYDRATDDVRAEFYGKIRTGAMTQEQAEAWHYHEVWSRASKEAGLDYSRYEHDYND